MEVKGGGREWRGEGGREWRREEGRKGGREEGSITVVGVKLFKGLR